MADLDRRQDEYSEMVSGLTKSHEDQLQRQASHLSSVAEQRLSEISVSTFVRFSFLFLSMNLDFFLKGRPGLLKYLKLIPDFRSIFTFLNSQLKAKLRNEELEQRLRSTEASLKAELDEARREHGRQVDLHQHLENELAHRNAEANTFYARLDTLQVEFFLRAVFLFRVGVKLSRIFVHSVLIFLPFPFFSCDD